MSQFFQGLDPLAYMGVRAQNPPAVVVSHRAPLGTDKLFPLGTLWLDQLNSVIYSLLQVVNNAAVWTNLGGAGADVSTLTGDSGTATPTAGNIKIAGGTNISTVATSGPGVVTVSTVGSPSFAGTVTAGTGVVSTTGNIAASAGNVTASGTMTAGTGITATTGNIAASAGNLSASGTVTGGTGVVATTGSITATAGAVVISTAGQGVILGGGAFVVCGTGDPNGAVSSPKGSLYLNLTGSGVADRAFINNSSGTGTVWVAVTTAS